MAVGDVQASSFEFYEGIRILVPGAIAVAAYGAMTTTFELNTPSPTESAAGALVAALLVGLLLYFIDLPARSQVYKAALPHTVLDTWTKGERGGLSSTNLYFVLLDEGIPAGIRSRALYMGSIFRIGFEAIYVLGLASTAVFVLAALEVGSVERDGRGVAAILWISCCLHVACPLMMALVAARTNRAALGRARSQLVALPALLALSGPALVAAVLIFDVAAWIGLVGVLISTAAWVALYIVGVPVANGRRNLAALPASVLVGASGAAAAAFAACGATDPSRLGSAGAVGWSLASLAALLMVAVRGHERKWFGAYYTQRAWIQLHAAELKPRYAGIPVGDPDPDRKRLTFRAAVPRATAVRKAVCGVRCVVEKVSRRHC